MGEETDLEAALARLSDDGLVAFPTETVWGLAARALSGPAMSGLLAWKGRSEGQPISVLVDGSEQLEAYGFSPSPVARALMRRFWPGPVTFVLPCEARFGPGIAREDGAVGLRCSADPVAASLARGALERGLGPITATSLNRSGGVPAVNRDEARALCGGGRQILFFAPGGCDAGGEVPSSVIDLTGPEPRILRKGARDREILAAARAVSD